jgi:hypothetical protein
MKLEMRSENGVRKADVETIPSQASLREMVDYVNAHFNLNKSSHEKKNSLLA